MGYNGQIPKILEFKLDLEWALNGWRQAQLCCERTELRKQLEGMVEKSDRAPVRQPSGHPARGRDKGSRAGS